MFELCVERVWDNGDMTDCGLPATETVKGRPLCAKHIPKPKSAKPRRIKDVSWNPTTEEAEEYLRAHGVDPKDVVNGFIEQLLKERSELQSQLAQVTQERDTCWHCGAVLINVPKPRCEDCPDECDVVNCNAMGCVDKLAQQYLDSWK